MKVLKGPKQRKREKTGTILDRFERLLRSLAPLRKGQQIKRGVYRIPKSDRYDYNGLNLSDNHKIRLYDIL